MKVVSKIKDFEKIVIEQYGVVELELTICEAEMLWDILANIGGKGEVREFTALLFKSLNDIGVKNAYNNNISSSDNEREPHCTIEMPMYIDDFQGYKKII